MQVEGEGQGERPQEAEVPSKASEIKVISFRLPGFAQPKGTLHRSSSSRRSVEELTPEMLEAQRKQKARWTPSWVISFVISFGGLDKSAGFHLGSSSCQEALEEKLIEEEALAFGLPALSGRALARLAEIHCQLPRFVRTAKLVVQGSHVQSCFSSF